MKTIKTEKEYKEFIKDKQPKQKLLKNCINAFIWGGAICTFGQILFDINQNVFGFDQKMSAIVESMTLIFIGAFLTSIGVYDNIGKRAGAGSIVPITGFANSIVAPAIEFKKEGYVLGVGAKMFTLAGPVIVYGTSSSIILGLLYYFLK